MRNSLTFLKPVWAEQILICLEEFLISQVSSEFRISFLNDFNDTEECLEDSLHMHRIASCKSILLAVLNDFSSFVLKSLPDYACNGHV